jgi:trimeric autotransporter adhesin
MKPSIKIKITTLPVVIRFVFGCFAILPGAQAVSPAPDGGYPGGNTAEGQNALFGLTTGSYNTAVGFLALESNTTASFNTALGAGALLANTADNNTAIGAGALLSNTTGDRNNACGAFALFSNTTGGANNAIGYKALFDNTTGFQNNAHGDFALFSNFEGHFNTALGGSALANNMSGNNNTAVGFQALQNSSFGSNNIALGFGAGSNIRVASDTICIGIAGVDTTDSCYIGHVFEEALDPDHLAMAIDVNGKVGTPASSRRFKEDIKPIDKASEAILALNPVTFHYKNDKKRRAQFGLIAEEVAEVDSSLVACDKQGKPYSVRYDQVNAMLLNEFLKEHRKGEEQDLAISQLKSILAQQQKTFEAKLAQQEQEIAALKAQLQRLAADVELNKAESRTLAEK